MATTAAPWSMPYPVGTDRVMDGDDVMHALADQVHAKLTQSLMNVPITGVACALAGTYTGGGVIAMRSGWVHLVVNASKATALVGGETMFVIPAGYRPAGAATLYGACFLASSGGIAAVSIAPATGNVAIVIGTPANTVIGALSYPL